MNAKGIDLCISATHYLFINTLVRFVLFITKLYSSSINLVLAYVSNMIASLTVITRHMMILGTL